MKSSQPRELALRILTQVLSEQRSLDEVPEWTLTSLPAESRGWLQEVVLGTLRWKGRLDLVIDSIALKKKPSGWLRKVLLVGAYQLIAQDRVPSAWVVSESVDLIKKREGEAPARFANALLRRVSDHAAEWRDMKGDTAEWASLPRWFWDRLVRDHGLEWSRAFAQAALQRPRIWVRARENALPSFSGLSSWASPGPLPESWEVREGGAVALKPGFDEGLFFVQDLSSQFLVHEVTRLVREQRGVVNPSQPLRALDLCAAPGGKAVGLAWSGFEVTATDQSAARMDLLLQTVRRVAPEVRTVSREESKALGGFDLVWIDAPCSGSGIIRRHPDVRWLKQEKDLAALVKAQRQLLEEGWNQVGHGGYLAFTVCSVFHEEGKQHFNSLGLTKGRICQEWLLAPHLGWGGDGFWGVLVQKDLSS